jgi:hypothetical protein
MPLAIVFTGAAFVPGFVSRPITLETYVPSVTPASLPASIPPVELLVDDDVVDEDEEDEDVDELPPPLADVSPLDEPPLDAPVPLDELVPAPPLDAEPDDVPAEASGPGGGPSMSTPEAPPHAARMASTSAGATAP